jgi:hypothetical protein
MTIVFERNLSALARFDPPLAERIKAIPWPSAEVTVIPSRSGAPSAKARSHDGVEVLIHSEYDPAREARRLTESRPLGDFDLYVLNGFGLGYLPLEVAAKADPIRWLVCVEAHEGLFRAAMESVDLTPLFERERVSFFVGRDWVRFQGWLEQLLRISAAVSLTIITHPACVRFFPKFYEGVKSEIDRVTFRKQIDIITLKNFGQAIERNAIRNIPYVARSVGARSFFGAFAGVPAIVVGAGPSLNSAIPLLREAQGKAVIIVVSRALRLLVSEGIVPDFVASLDMLEDVQAFFRGFDIPARSIHLFDPDSFYGANRDYPGSSVSFETSSPISLWSRGFLGDRGHLGKGTTVTHTSFYFAHAAGASPILLVGVDLAIPGEKMHAKGVTRLGLDDGVDAGQQYTMIPGVRGEPVRTDPLFAVYVGSFEVGILNTGARMIQTSEIGAAIRGAEHMPLARAVELYVSRRHPIQEVIQGVMKQRPAFSEEAFGQAASEALTAARRVHALCEEGLEFVRRLGRLDPANKLDQPNYLKLWKRADALREEVRREDRFLWLVYRLTAVMDVDVRILKHEFDAVSPLDPNRNKIAVRQVEVFLRETGSAAQFFMEQMELVREQIRKEHDGVRSTGR